MEMMREGEGPRKFGKESLRGERQPTTIVKPKSLAERVKEKGVIFGINNSSALRSILNDKIGEGNDLRDFSDKLVGAVKGPRNKNGWGARDLHGDGSDGKKFLEADEYGFGTDGRGPGETGFGPDDRGNYKRLTMFRNKSQVIVTPQKLSKSMDIVGEMDPEIIMQIIKDHLGYFKWCYEKELNINPRLSGKLTADFVIGINGRVTSSRIKKSSLHNSAVESCVARKIRVLKFPAPENGIVQVYYPFVFRSPGRF